VEELSERAKVLGGRGMRVDIAFLPAPGRGQCYSPDIEAWLAILQSVRCGEFDVLGRFRLIGGGSKICKDTIHEASILFPEEFPKIIKALTIDMTAIVENLVV
jgi:hypothetical protein